MKINTGLPYDFDLLNEINEKGAIVDLSNINYPNLDETDNIKITFIYLRNTGYENIDLDFSKTSFEFKEKFLLYYLQGDIEYKLKECNDTWIKILGFYNNQNFPVKSFLSEEEIIKFINNNLEYLKNLNTFIISLPLYPISKMTFDDDTNLDLEDIEKTENIICNNSICGIISNPYFMYIYETIEQSEPCFYSKIFTLENNELFNTIINHTPFATILYGMCQDNWSEFTNGLEEILKTMPDK